MNTSLKATFATAALVGVWGDAEADGMVSLETNRPLEHATGFYYYNSSVDRQDDSRRFVREFQHGSLAATSDSLPHRLEVLEDRGEPINVRYPYTVMGVYDVPQSFVSILLKKSVADEAIANALTWDQVFLPSNPAYVSELQVAGYLTTASFPEYGRFMEAYADLFPAWNQEATLVHFSGATFGGTAIATPVPEPASLAILGLGSLGLLRRRKACG